MENTEKRNETTELKAVSATAIDDKVRPAESILYTENNKQFSETVQRPDMQVSDKENNDFVKEENTAEFIDKTSDGNSEDEVVFAGADIANEKSEDYQKKNKSSKKKKNETVNEDDTEEAVVFAAAAKKERHTHIPVQKKNKKLPVAIIAASIAVLLIGAGAVTVAMNIKKDSAAVSTETSLNSTSPEGDGNHQTSSNQITPSDLNTEMPVIDNIDTTNILFGNGVTVEGVELGGKTLSQAYKVMQDRLVEIREPISIIVVCDGKSLSLTQNDFNYDTNVSSVLLQAYHYSRGEFDDPTVEYSKNGDTTDFKVLTALNSESVDAAIEKAANFFDVKPIDAHVTKFDPTAAEKFTFEDGKDGYLLDHDELNTKIKNIINSGEKSGTISIETHKTHFKVSMDEIKANTRLIASHYTTAMNRYESVHNMTLAIKAASGTVIGPGEVFSFNEMTGDTTNGNTHNYPNGTTGAYMPSTAYRDGKVVLDEYGGGICQASTTLYLCALKANMEILERRSHMYASSYAPYGLDATVDYGSIDMKFRNPFDFPIYIATYVYDYNYDGLNELMVEIYGPLSEEYDEIVPAGWVTYAGNKSFSAAGAKVYFKNGKEIKRVYLPTDSYDYHFESYYYVINYIPSDINFGPVVSPTYSVPTVFSPGGCGSSAPIAYGSASDVLAKARSSSAGTEASA